MAQGMGIVWTHHGTAGERHSVGLGRFWGWAGSAFPTLERCCCCCCCWQWVPWGALPTAPRWESGSLPALAAITDGFLQYKEGSWQGSVLDNTRIGCVEVLPHSSTHSPAFIPLCAAEYIRAATSRWFPHTCRSLLRESCLTTRWAL